MKQLIIAALLLISVQSYGQYAAVPDTAFGDWLYTNGYSSCLTGNSSSGWQLDTTCPVVLGTVSLNIQPSAFSIPDIRGIQYFKNLDSLTVGGLYGVGSLSEQLPPALLYLKCANDNLSGLPALPVTLTYLDCSRNFLVSLPPLPSSLSFLNCNNCQFHSLPALPASLTYIDCSYDLLDSLPALPSGLRYLDCSNIGINSLPALPASLDTLFCSDNHLTQLPALPSSLSYLDCDANNNLSSLPALPASLTYLDAGGITATSLPALPPGLTFLALSEVPLGSLPVLPATLTYLDCYDNKLSTFPPLPSGLLYFNCAQMATLTSIPNIPASLTSLDFTNDTHLSCLPPIYQTTLTSFYISGSNITCLPDNFTAINYDIDPATLPICATGNANGCTTLAATDTTVWPGDVDNNWVVNNLDLLPIGLGYDSTGPARTVQGIVWQGDPATGWGQSFVNYTYPVNYDHADCNGDGTINADDTLAIITNYSLTHAKTGNLLPTFRSGIPGFTLLMSADTVLNNATLTTNIFLGDSNLPVSGIYGLAFTLNYDPIVTDSNPSFAFIQSWLGDAGNSISIHKNFNSGQVQVAITGINHLSRSGYGKIAVFIGDITTGNINGKTMSYYPNIQYISDITAIDQYGNAIALNGGQDSSYVGFFVNGISTIDRPVVTIYPNPAATQVRVSADEAITSITITDMLGKDIQHIMANGKQSEIIDISSLANGIYTLHAAASGGTTTVKLIVSR